MIASFEAGIIYENRKILSDNPTLIGQINTRVGILWSDYLEREQTKKK